MKAIAIFALIGVVGVSSAADEFSRADFDPYYANSNDFTGLNVGKRVVPLRNVNIFTQFLL